MYEVGVALACRLPHEVLLVRDDEETFLFDVSTIPHKKIDFTHTEQAKLELTEALISRLREQTFQADARVEIAISRLSAGETAVLKRIASKDPTTAWGFGNAGDVTTMVSIPRLLDKQLIRVVGAFDDGSPGYQATELGYVAARLLDKGLRTLKSDVLDSVRPPEGSTNSSL
jgi:hypothetical protein